MVGVDTLVDNVVVVVVMAVLMGPLSWEVVVTRSQRGHIVRVDAGMDSQL
jgi:hypothetical protein